ncbi:MAG: response regulator transcription factor [Flavobacteriales bacterium]|nr:response regulator transcription factor [Flavobacteriales bacterium]
MSAKRILLVDDQSIILDGLTALLKEEKDLKVVGMAHNGAEAISEVARLQPDVVVMDISMPPGMDGIEATKRIRDRWPDVRVLVLSMYHQKDMVTEVIDAGASGYVLKNTDRKQFSEALRTVAAGHRYLAPEVSKLLDEANDPAQPAPPVPTLTRREKEIIRLVAQSHSTQEISDALGLSYATVETHRRNVMHKLGLKNPAGLVRYAMERGWNT